MPDPASPAPRVLVYGSCVARDTIEFAEADTVDLRGYVARQSLISVGSDASAHLPTLDDVSSKFQGRMIQADFAGSLPDRLDKLAPEVDVLLWDLADERHGVHRFPDGTVVTRSIDTMKVTSVSAALDGAVLVPFGTDEHFALWRERVEAFTTQLRGLGLFDRTVVLDVPWAIRTTEGDPAPWSMGVRAGDANKRYRRYYDELRLRGFRMVELPEEVVLADPQHRWGLAPFHYSPDVYREVLRQLREVHGFDGFAEAS
ncbi:DUF6270 domain-containing protein [Agrococcus sp. Marseille-P2731]|uniref:DUF6270 domain-containing protein n=1 Tax=Agrococcus sp. Marseille-P2731 TaxID=1841862 RepID=UPI000931CA55|nr:DUF6270 domain-containing protein [Agrococcus sp. Marseille-P2731]